MSLSDYREIQEEIRRRIVIKKLHTVPRIIGGCDVSYTKRGNTAVASICIFSYPELEFIGAVSHKGKVSFPYVPTYLSFREFPLIRDAYIKLDIKPDLLMVDGQGIAHPRRVGIASHIGVELNLATIGCAKTHLFGDFLKPEKKRGASSSLNNGKEVIGAVLCTKDNTNPLFVSPGHWTSVEDSIRYIMMTTGRYKIPEPIRQAHILSRRLIEKTIIKNAKDKS